MHVHSVNFYTKSINETFFLGGDPPNNLLLVHKTSVWGSVQSG